jgi:hypothetical protein
MAAATTMPSSSSSSNRLTSAAGLLALLEEPQDALKVHGLRCLNDVAMTSQWPEVASHVGVIEGMHEDEFFSHRDLAALVASKVCVGWGRFFVRLVVSFFRSARAR